MSSACYEGTISANLVGFPLLLYPYEPPNVPAVPTDYSLAGYSKILFEVRCVVRVYHGTTQGRVKVYRGFVRLGSTWYVGTSSRPYGRQYRRDIRGFLRIK